MQNRIQKPPPRNQDRQPDADAPDDGDLLLWIASVDADGTPARLYLAARDDWPPDGTGPDLPP